MHSEYSENLILPPPLLHYCWSASTSLRFDFPHPLVLFCATMRYYFVVSHRYWTIGRTMHLYFIRPSVPRAGQSDSLASECDSADDDVWGREVIRYAIFRNQANLQMCSWQSSLITVLDIDVEDKFSSWWEEARSHGMRVVCCCRIRRITKSDS